jgi:hypothetical protein
MWKPSCFVAKFAKPSMNFTNPLPHLFGFLPNLWFKTDAKPRDGKLKMMGRRDAETGEEAPFRNTCRQGPARWRPSPQSSYPVPRLTRAAGRGAQAWLIGGQSLIAKAGPLCSGDCRSPMGLLVRINLAPTEFREGSTCCIRKGAFR